MLRRSGKKALLAIAGIAILGAFASFYMTRRGPSDTVTIPRNPSARLIGGSDDGYIDPASCATCHPKIAAAYSQTGMARSFYRARPEKMVEDFAKANSYYHAPSDERYTMIVRGGDYFQRRHQLAGGREVNAFEQQIHYVMGSGNHARTYLHLDPAGKLTQLPLGWYSEKGGFWAMNPNYDLPQHSGFQREIGFGCMFCHNGYPEVAPGEDGSGREPRYRGRLPEGIDCQRCHGPGRDHVKAISSGGGMEKVRAAILNPARLAPERQLEICMQCHLETTTRSLPHSIVRFDRGVFSFRPGEPLENYELNFDYAPGKGPKGLFEIAHTVYRLRQSACFLSTAGTPRAMTCTTCHNPHQALRGEEATAHYQAVCRQCHAATQHTVSGDCLGCHMPKRRTSDVVHTVMTDHYIQRRKPAGDLLAPLGEQHETETTRYRGEVVPYYPPQLPQTEENELYVAAAQVVDASNLEKGIPRLQAAIDRSHPKQAGFYFHLAEAYTKSGREATAFPLYEAAVERAPKHRDAWLGYGLALSKAGKVEEAAAVLERALKQLPDDPLVLNNLGEVYLAGKPSKALESLRRAVEIDPALVAAQNNLGLAYSALGNTEQAVRSWQEAIRIQPGTPIGHNSLANSFADRGDFAQAETHYRLAIRFDPGYVDAHFNYAILLAGQGKSSQAESELREVIKLDPNSALAYSNLAGILQQKGNTRGAIEQYRMALVKDPTLDRPHLGLGMALGSLGDYAGARREFEQAAKSPDPSVHDAAGEALKKLQTVESSRQR